MSVKSDSTRRCKKYGKGRGNGSHHTRRDRVADPAKASEAQTKRKAHRAKPVRSQSHVKTTAQVPGNRPKDVDRRQGEARPKEERRFPNRTPDFAILGTATPAGAPNQQTLDRVLRGLPGDDDESVIICGPAPVRPVPIGDNTTTVDALSKIAEPETTPAVTDTDRDAAVAAIAKAVDAEVTALLALPIEELDLAVRPYNALKREGVNSIGDLVGKTEGDLLDIRGVGKKSIDWEIKPKLAALQQPLALKDDTPATD